MSFLIIYIRNLLFLYVSYFLYTNIKCSRQGQGKIYLCLNCRPFYLLSGEEDINLPPEARKLASWVGYQRLALQIIGALKAPISKKKIALSWVEISDIVVELRKELGLESI